MKTPEEWYDVIVNTHGRKERMWAIKAIQEEALDEAANIAKAEWDRVWGRTGQFTVAGEAFNLALLAIRFLKGKP